MFDALDEFMLGDAFEDVGVAQRYCHGRLLCVSGSRRREDARR
jgi:hypothetical protein